MKNNGRDQMHVKYTADQSLCFHIVESIIIPLLHQTGCPSFCQWRQNSLICVNVNLVGQPRTGFLKSLVNFLSELEFKDKSSNSGELTEMTTFINN